MQGGNWGALRLLNRQVRTEIHVDHVENEWAVLGRKEKTKSYNLQSRWFITINFFFWVLVSCNNGHASGPSILLFRGFQEKQRMVLNGGATPYRTPLEQRWCDEYRDVLSLRESTVRSGRLSNQAGSTRSLLITEIKLLFFNDCLIIRVLPATTLDRFH